MAVTIHAILKELGNEKLELERVHGHGYHIFVYDDPENNIFETHSVMVPFLNRLDYDQWIAEGKHFLKTMTASD